MEESSSIWQCQIELAIPDQSWLAVPDCAGSAIQSLIGYRPAWRILIG
jgi:hypothetical protein